MRVYVRRAAATVVVATAFAGVASAAQAQTTNCGSLEAQGAPVNVGGGFTVASSDLVRNIQTHDLPRSLFGRSRCSVAKGVARQVVGLYLSNGGVPGGTSFPSGERWKVGSISADNTLTLGIARRGRESITFRF